MGIIFAALLSGLLFFACVGAVTLYGPVIGVGLFLIGVGGLIRMVKRL